ncbi:MAG TPA: glucose-6-phosphate dehydrogenase, partial [Candidatus Lustribacter sp.]|nr:glucose-6-phosphate dehydrogenase [Candidatus Lustribacter sp.]
MTQTVAGSNGAPGGDVNPLRAGVASSRITDPCNIVFFGASGDLCKRMLMPAMYNLRLEDIMPANFGIIGLSRCPWDNTEFQTEMRKSIDEFSRSGPAKDPLWSDFAKRLSFVDGSFDDSAAFKELRKVIEDNDAKLKTGGNRLFYLSTPPSLFGKIIDMLDEAGLGPNDNKTGWTRIIIEKPFGTDLDSARALQAEVSKVFDERSVYRIDHYLGKEPV